MRGPAGVMALVLIEAAAGGAAILFLTPLWNEVRRGFFYLTGSIVLALAAGAAGAAAGGYDASTTSARRVAVGLAAALAVATLLWLALVAFRLRALGRIVGIATVPLGVAALVAFARTTDQSLALAVFEL